MRSQTFKRVDTPPAGPLDARGYSRGARLFHWITPVLLVGSFGLVWSLGWLPAGPQRIQAVNIHRTIGLLVLGVTIIRLVWRIFDRRPTRLGTIPVRWAAGVLHVTLFVALMVIPLLGWTYTNARGHNVVFFGLSLPTLIFKDEYVSRVAINVHEWLAYTLIGLIVVHVMAALWHHFWLRDLTLKRMWRM